ncbi:MAG TPA: hypothetical protein VMU17_02915 [Elusimicrobiota bacterium]|nr:hypothetical protein [Elusimicrobiota bacterium]
MQQCPKCNAAVDEADKECNTCGIFFSKWREREENVASGNLSRYSAIAAATSSEFNWTIFLIICAAIGIVFFFVGHHIRDIISL